MVWTRAYTRGKEAESKGPGTRSSSQDHTLSEILSPAKCYFLEFLKPSKIGPPARDQAFVTQHFGENTSH